MKNEDAFPSYKNIVQEQSFRNAFFNNEIMLKKIVIMYGQFVAPIDKISIN